MQPLSDYSIFLDDERAPSYTLAGALVVRSFWEFKQAISDFGIPKFVSFDHDLGDNEYTGKKCAEYLIMQMESMDIDVSGFDYYVHSQNPIGAKNIRTYLDSWLKELGK